MTKTDDPPRALNVLIDRCKGCLCCHPGRVPGTRLCKHPLLPKALPVLDEDYERATVPAFCPAPGTVLLVAGPPPSATRCAMDFIARTAADDVQALMHAGPGPHYAGLRVMAGPDDTTSPFHVGVEGVAACDRSLVLKAVVPASAVTLSRRCQRGPCKVLWPTGHP
jgi:hypothetical protein